MTWPTHSESVAHLWVLGIWEPHLATCINSGNRAQLRRISSRVKHKTFCETKWDQSLPISSAVARKLNQIFRTHITERLTISIRIRCQKRSCVKKETLAMQFSALPREPGLKSSFVVGFQCSVLYFNSLSRAWHQAFFHFTACTKSLDWPSQRLWKMLRTSCMLLIAQDSISNWTQTLNVFINNSQYHNWLYVYHM